MWHADHFLFDKTNDYWWLWNMAGPERFRRFYTKMVCLDNQINYDIL